MNFLELFDRYIYHFVNSGKTRDKRDPDTIRTYRSRGDLVGNYLMLHGSVNLSPEMFGPVIADNYFEFLCVTGYKHNYAARCVGICKSVLKFGVRKELIDRNPLSEFTIQKEPPAPPVFLTPEELKRVVQMRPALDCLKKTRDMFLFQCLTGMDYGDTTTITEEHLIEYMSRRLIKKSRNKTGVEAIIPLKDEALQILKRNNFNMKLLCNQRYNKYLKSIAAFCKIKKHLTSHVGRKTYAMIELNYNGMEITPLSKHLGHSSVSTTELYYAQPQLMAVILELERMEKNNALRIAI